MKFVFPDSLDLVDPSFDFATAERSSDRVRQRDDQYAHEVFREVPFHGLLVSKAIVDGLAGASSAKYTMAQRQRLLREGVRPFFRLSETNLFTMGDCGAFSYVREKEPPYTVEEVARFYANCGFDIGISVDHVILDFNEKYDEALPGLDLVPAMWRERQTITLELASQFLSLHKRERPRFAPMGVAQGWSPQSYAFAVAELQKMGYKRIALGGLVPLKTKQIVASLQAANGVRKAGTEFHLLGVTRTEAIATFASLGTSSFDSTSPLRQAFKDDKDNYYTIDTTYAAVRVPQVEGNPKLGRQIKSGQVDFGKARTLEQRCLDVLARLDRGSAPLEEALDALRAYEVLYDPSVDRTEVYRRTLGDRPWKRCACEICQRLGIHVILFRGAERNRRRGFHNLYVFRQRLNREFDITLRK